MPEYGPGTYGSNPGPSNPSQLSPSAPGYNANWTADGSPNAGANMGINAQYAGITGNIRAANEARINSLRSQEVGQIQGAQDFGQQSTQFADAQLGRIGGFEGSYRIGLQNSIANRTEKNIGTIKRATEEAIQTGNAEMQSRLADLGFQQMKLMADLNQQQFERSLSLHTQANQDAQLKLAQDAAARQGKAFQQLDNGDYGYFDEVTGKFVKQGNAAKPVSGGSGNYDSLSGLPKGFMNAAETGLSQLQKGEQWGPVWNRMKLQYPNVSNDVIDRALGGSAGSTGYFESPTGKTVGAREASGFARPGAFEDFKRANLAGNYADPSKYERNKEMFATIARWKNEGRTYSEIQNQIRVNELDPKDFGYGD